MATNRATAVRTGRLSGNPKSTAGATLKPVSFRARRPQSIGSAPPDVQREIGEQEMAFLAADYAAMPEHVLQSMAFAAFVDWFRSWRQARRGARRR